MIDIIPLSLAQELVRLGIVRKIETEMSPFKVIFGKEGAVSDIDSFIRGAGLLDKVFVSSDVREALISDITFTDKGITIVKTSGKVRGFLSDGTLVFTGHRDRSNSDRALWHLDLIQLLKATLPSPTSSFPNACYHTSHPTLCLSARPTHSHSDVREARRLQRSVGCLGGIADSIEAGAITDVPPGVVGGLLRKVASHHDYIPYELSHRRRYLGGGSVTHTLRPGAEFSFDEIGKWEPSTFGATTAVLIADRAT